MLPEIEWFIFAMTQNELVGLDDAKQLHDSLPNPDLGTYAQTMLNQLCASLPQESANMLLQQIQSVMDYAVQQAATGTRPGLFPDAAPAAAPAPAAPPAQKINTDMSSLPSLDNLDSMDDQTLRKTMIDLLVGLRGIGASDLHISAKAPPFIRRSLKLERISQKPLTEEDSARLNKILLTQEQIETLEAEKDMNLAMEFGPNRFRVALMYHKDGIGGSYRLVPDRIRSLLELGFLPQHIPTIERMLDYTNGLVLVTGALGGGKTSTLASMVDVLNSKRQDHVIMVEDPIEILQPSKKCQVTQRQVGSHTVNYHSALKGALREDPDIIVIGEMHDLETIENAITASETGHLVIGTLHTSDAANTLNRILDVFPPTQQPQIRAMTAGSLRGIICQQLIPAKNGGLTLGYEIMVNTIAASNLINEGKTFQLKATMQIGSKQGMCTFDQCLLEKFNQDIITYEVALSYMTDASSIQQLKQANAVREAKKLQAARAR